MSDDGTQGITLIAFVGSVFSPYYAWARRHGTPDPVNHCALNVALYGSRAARWAMTERGVSQVTRSASRLTLGRSTLDWTGDAMDIQVDEVCSPLPRRIRGTIRLTPTGLSGDSFVLDAAGLHSWTPFAPCAHVQVRLAEPDVTWSGVAYLDSNFGAEPVETAFRDWTWSRASLPGGTVVLYDLSPRASAAHSLALSFDRHGTPTPIELPPVCTLPGTGWRIPRRTRADAGRGARIVQTLEDAPFYSRSVLETHLQGRSAPAIHESLDLDRFDSTWVQCLLPFRMPRRVF